jgi:L-lactate dehydrogenase complex protein LldG
MGELENASRAAILGRIRDALKTPAPDAEAPRGVPVFPPVTDMLERFGQECAGNLVECIMTTDPMDSAKAFATTMAELPEGEVWLQDAPELRALMAPAQNRPSSASAAPANVHWSSEGRPNEAAQATVTLAEVLVAATGSIFVSSACGGRAGSVAAPVHIVFARKSQLLPDLDAAFARLYEQGTAQRNSFVGLITGSSRTADIEKILVLGAHGPRRVVLILELTG